MKKFCLALSSLLVLCLPARAQQWTSYTNFNYVSQMAFQPGNGIIWGATPGGIFSFSSDDTVLIKHYTNVDGLPYIEVSSVILDDHHNKWIGTLGGGLARLDSIGDAWTVFIRNDGLASDTVLCTAANGQDIFAGGSGSISYYNGYTWFSLLAQQGYKLGDRTQALAARNDSLWIATDQGLCIARISPLASIRDTNNWTTFNSYDGLSLDIRCIFLTDTLSMIGTADGAARLVGGVWQRVPELGGQIRSIAGVGDSLLFATDNGVKLWRQGVLSDISSGLSTMNALSLAVDGEGRPWAGSDQGMAVFRDGSWQKRTFPGPRKNYISKIALSYDGAVWATHESTFLSRLKDNQWTDFTMPFPGIPFKTIVLDGDGQAWIGLTWGSHFLKVLKNDSLAVIDSCVPLNTNIWASYIDGGNGKYFSAYSQSILFLSPDGSHWATYTDPAPRGAYSNAMWIISIAKDPAGGLWLGSYYNDLTYFNPQNNTWEHFGIESGIPDINIRQIVIDKTNTVWLATGNGLCRSEYDPVTHIMKSTVYQTNNSPVLGNDIRSIAIDRSDNKWIGTDGGLSLLTWDGKWINYNQTDGYLTGSKLISNDIQQIAACPHDQSGDDIYIATSKGLSFLSYNDVILRTAEQSYVAPNPFNSTKDDYIYFSNLPSEARIDIYTLDGRPCGTFHGPPAPAHTLAIRPDTEFSRRPVSGIYLCRIQSTGQKPYICKLVIVR